MDDVAKAILGSFQSPNVVDSNGEEANVVDVLDDIARALHRMADGLERISYRKYETESDAI
jgi:hypothetical protein